MFVDDRPSHPMSFVIAIDLSGDLRETPMKQAVVEALRRHPLLTSRVSIGLRGRQWTPCSTPPKIEICSINSSPRLTHLNLKREAGLRTWIQTADEGGRVSFQFHHAATDGLGAMQFIGDVLALYAQQTSDDADEVPELSPIDPRVLHLRGTMENPTDDAPPGFFQRLKTLYCLMSRSASSIATPDNAKAGRNDQSSEESLLTLPPYVSRLGERSLLRGLKRVAARRTIHLNDVYMAVLFHTVCEWNRLCGQAQDDRLIRMALPASLRTPDHDLSPAANIVNIVYINRNESECSDLGELLSRAAETANAATEDRLFCRMLWRGRQIPGLMEVGSRLPYTFATMVLTNVGEVKRQFRTRFPLEKGRCIAGSVVLEGLRGTAPLRPGTHVAVSIGSYGGKLFVNAAFDPNFYGRADADRFLQMYFQQLCDLAETAADAAKTAA